MSGASRFLAVASAILLAGCGGVTEVNQFPQTVTVKFGDEFHVVDPDLTVRFAEVVQDSRCPVNAECVQAGSVTLRFSLIEPGGALNTLFISSDEPASASHGISLRLISVDPVPRLGMTTDPRDYRATVEVTSAP